MRPRRLKTDWIVQVFLSPSNGVNEADRPVSLVVRVHFTFFGGITQASERPAEETCQVVAGFDVA